MLTFGSLFSGIGGLDLGLERAGMKCLWQVEIDGYRRKVLEKHWPGVKRFWDIRAIDKSKLKRVGCICGGFNCQPFSVAGQRKGTEDERYIWPEFRETIRKVEPRWALVENVPGLLSIDSGKIFSTILADLAEMGYDAWWGSIRASDCGAPIPRERIFIVAFSEKRNVSRALQIKGGKSRIGMGGKAIGGRGSSIRNTEFNVAIPHIGYKDRRDSDVQVGWLWNEKETKENGVKKRIEWCVEPTLHSLANGFSPGLDLAGLGNEYIRVAKGIPERANQIQSLGDAVVPQVAEFIGNCIMQAERKSGGLECHI